MITADEILDAYHFRHACKVFDPEKKIPEDTFETILETGRLSPSSFGFEPWKFLVVQDPTLREKLLPVTWGAQKMLPTASHYLIILARKRPDLIWSSDYITHMMRDIHHLSPTGRAPQPAATPWTPTATLPSPRPTTRM